LKDYIEERVLEVAKYIIDSKSTIRRTAKQFGVSKSTIHKDITERLPKIILRLPIRLKKYLNTTRQNDTLEAVKPLR